MSLSTVADYVNSTRIMLQDQKAGAYRYTDAEIILALNYALLETRRIRPDMYIGYPKVPVQSFTVNDATPVLFEESYRMALVYFMAGYTQLKDDETNQDTRATIFMNKFVAQLTKIEA